MKMWYWTEISHSTSMPRRPYMCWRALRCCTHSLYVDT